MTQVKFVPVLHENAETKGIVGTDQMNLDVEVPDEYKIWLKTTSTNNSNNGVSFQISNVNKFIDGSMRVDLTIKFSYTGRTYEALAGPPALLTPAVLWDPNVCKIDALAINKLIQRITFNIQNKNWTEEQRFPELFDVFASQFDLEKMESYGIDPFTDQGQLKLSYLFGNGKVSRADIDDAGLNYAFSGYQTALVERKEFATTVQKAIEKGYVSVSSNFSVGGVPLIGEYHSAINSWVPTVGGVIFYTNPAAGAPNANELKQDVTLVISEYIISPSLSNPYTKNKFQKSYYVGAYPVNLTFDFNTNYFNTMIKNLVPTWNDQGAVGQPSVSSAPQIQPSTIGMYSFDSAKELVNPYQRTLYYDLSFQTMNAVQVNSATWSQKNTSRVVTANLSSLRPYIFGWVSMRPYENPAFVTATGAPNNVSTLGTYQFQQINNVRLSYGSQTDCMLGTQMTWKEISDLTVEVMGNPKLRNMVYGFMFNNESQSLFDYSVAGQNYGDAGDRDLFQQKMAMHAGMQFFILPTARLNWRPISQSDIPLIPEFNYGSNNFKSLIIEIDWFFNQNAIDIIGTNSAIFTCQPVVALVEKRVRSIPMDGQGNLFDERVEYDYINNNAMLSSIIREYEMRNNSANDVNNELQFVGGSFIGNIVSKIRNVVPHLVKAAPHILATYKALKGEGKKGRPAKRR